MSNSPQSDKTRKISVDVINLLTWSLEQAAAVCGISSGTFRNWVREGIMPQPFHGRRYSAADVKRASKKYEAHRSRNTSAKAYDKWSDENDQS